MKTICMSAAVLENGSDGYPNWSYSGPINPAVDEDGEEIDTSIRNEVIDYMQLTFDEVFDGD